MKTHAANGKVQGARRASGTQQATFELKHRVILSLNKLADRDTNQIGVEELERAVDRLSPEGIAPFLSCIVDTDSEHKSAVRKECVRIMGTLARFHGDLLGPHIGKMVTTIVKRLKDTDTVVRDACVEAVGEFASCVVGVPFEVLVKPLFEALGEQNRYVQIGSALCLAKVVDERRKPPVQILQQILSRVIKLLKNPHFMAKAALIDLVRSIVEAGGASTENLRSSAVLGIIEALKNTDWTTRKAASTALASISLSCASSLGSFKANCIRSLESCRFDKVKPVRDAVMHALQCWKNLPGRETFMSSDLSSATKENYIGTDSPDASSIGEGGWRDNMPKKSAPLSTISNKNQRSPLTMRKSSPNYKHREQCKSNDWHIEISLPKTHSSFQIDDPLHEESEGSCITKAFEHEKSATSEQNISFDDYEKTEFSSMLNPTSETFESKHMTVACCTSEVDSSVNNQSMTEEMEPESQAFSPSSRQHKSLDSTTISLSPRDSCLYASKEMSFIRKQLSDLESKQTNLLDLLQAFIGNSTSNMSILQSKVHNLEYAIEKMSQDILEIMAYPAISGSKIGRKNQSISSSPRLFNSTPRTSVDTNYRQPSLLSLRNSELWEDSTSSKNQSFISVKEFTDTKRDPALGMSWNSVARATQKNLGRGPEGSGNVHTRKVQESSVPGCIPRGKITTSESNNTLWKRIKDFMYKEDTEAAYVEALCTSDESVLIELMDKTGPVLEKLSDKLVNEILCTLAGKILDQKFLSSVIPWLQQVVDLSRLHGPKCLHLSAKARRELLLSIQEASSMDFCSPVQRVSLAQLAINLRHLWCDENQQSISNSRKISGSRHF